MAEFNSYHSSALPYNFGNIGALLVPNLSGGFHIVAARIIHFQNSCSDFITLSLPWKFFYYFPFTKPPDGYQISNLSHCPVPMSFSHFDHNWGIISERFFFCFSFFFFDGSILNKWLWYWLCRFKSRRIPGFRGPPRTACAGSPSSCSQSSQPWCRRGPCWRWSGSPCLIATTNNVEGLFESEGGVN